MAIFVCESGADKRRVFVLKEGKSVCGRSKEADVAVLDPFLSGKHFTIAFQGGSWFVEDLGSSNGIEINDVKVAAAKLEHGDLLRAGSTYLRFYERDESADEAAHEGLPDIHGYKINERIGVGGMGEVYRARQCSLDREVALKILSPAHAKDREFVEKFFREARAAGNLNHPNIVQVHDVGECNGICYICMEYVGGGDLTGRLRDDGKLPAMDAMRVTADVARGLEFAESRKIVHCDIKPDNIMFTESGTAKIADLGIARSVSGFQESRKEVFGSPHYMAPEQAMGKPVDHRADLYALGCTLFRMLAGRTPFTGSTSREVMKKQVVEEHPDLLKLAPECPPELADIVDFLMEKSPDERCPSATELLRLLDALMNPRKTVGGKGGKGKKHSGDPTDLHEKVLSSRRRREQERRKAMIPKLVGGVVALIIILVALKLTFGGQDRVQVAIDASMQKEKAGDYIGAVQALEELDIAENSPQAKLIALRLASLEKKKSEQLSLLRFERQWNDYLELRATGASREALEKKLDYLASNFEGNKEALSRINNERLRLLSASKK